MGTKLQVIGGGKMGQALIGGLIGDWAEPGEITVVDVSADQRAAVTETFSGVVVAETPVDGVDTVIAVKPHFVAEVCGSIHPTRVMSIAAGVTIAAMEEILPGIPVVRAMPNTPALVGAGCYRRISELHRPQVTW